MVTAPSARRWPARSQDPDELMNCRLSRCGSTAVRDRRRVTWPFFASATNSSTEKRSRSDRNASRLPSGLSAGPTFSLPPCFSVTSAVA